jgi:hypothetical protein
MKSLFTTKETQTRRDLISLRISIARLAQIANVEHEELPVLNKPYEALWSLAANQPRGWHRLLILISDRVPLTKDN